MTVRIVTGANGIKYITNEPFKPRLDQGADYERGFVDGMQKQMQSSVDKAVNRMAQPKQEPLAWISTGPARMIHWTADKPAYGDDWVPLYTTPPQRKEDK